MFFAIAGMVFASSIDSIALGLNYGVKKIKIPFLSKVIMFFATVITSYLSIFVGKKIGGNFTENSANLLGELILTAIGVYVIYSSIKKNKHKKNSMQKRSIIKKEYLRLVINSLGITIMVIKNPAKGDIDNSGYIDVKEALLLSTALSLDSAGICFGASLIGINSMLIPILMGFCHIGAFSLGKLFGSFLKQNHKPDTKIWSVVPGLILIIIATIKHFIS